MLKSIDVVNKVRLAESRIRSHIRQTILEHSRYLSHVGGANVYCKLENLQYTGSFKVRGAMNKLLSVMSEELVQGVVTASTGNHGVAVAHSVKELNASGIVFVTEDASSTKVQAIEQIAGSARLSMKRFDPLSQKSYNECIILLIIMPLWYISLFPLPPHHRGFFHI